MTPRGKQTGDAGRGAKASASSARAGCRHGQHFVIPSDALQTWTPMIELRRIDAGNSNENNFGTSSLSKKYFSKNQY